MNREIRKCRVGEIFDHPASAALFGEHADECANPLLGRTCPQRAMYEGLETAAVGQCFVVYVEGELAGFAFVLIGPLPHYEGRFATVESLFLRPLWRRGGLGRLLMNGIEAYAIDAGCVAIFRSAPLRSSSARRLATDRYWLTNRILTKRLR